MALFVPPQPSALGQGIGALGETLAAALKERQQRGRERQTGTLVQQAFKDFQASGGDPASFTSALGGIIGQGGDPAITTALGKQFTDLGKKFSFTQGGLENVRKILTSVMPEEQANQLVSIIPSLSTGGQTQFANFLFEQLSRGGFGREGAQIRNELDNLAAKDPSLPGAEPQGEPTEPSQAEQPRIIEKPSVGLLPKEQVKRETDLLKINEPEIRKLNQSIDTASLKQLDMDRLNEIFSDPTIKLPSSFATALFDLEGETGLSKIALSALEKMPEAQEVIKIVVNQLRGAKDTFGARVTQFEAQTYLKGIPSLSNTPSGRQLVAKQLSTINQINLLESQAIIDEFNKAGGSGKIAFSDAQARARKATAPQVDLLRKQYVNPNGSIFNVIPPAKSFEGKRGIDEETGQILISNGSEWVPVEG